jgi:hypothetical protein
MADDQQPVFHTSFEFVRARPGRRKVLAMLGILALLVIGCAAAIGLMLERLEARDVNFHPPMTPSERQLLMPAEPTLDVTPSVGGLRYGHQVGGEASDTPDDETGVIEGVVGNHLVLRKGGDWKEVNGHAQDLSHAP